MYDDFGHVIGAVTLASLSMNWGNHGEGDGWFSLYNFNPIFEGVQYNYNSYRQMIYNIVP